MQKEKDLQELVRRLREVAEANLVAVVLYGSAANGEFHDEFQEKYSDLNVLCVVRHASGAELAKLQPVGLWWAREGHPAPLVFTNEELRHSADIFAIELLDMKQRHKMLWGEDFLGTLEVPMALHRDQVERELRTNVARLRQAFLRSRGRRADLAELAIALASSFAVLFRHSLIALGEAAADAPQSSRREATERLGAVLGVDAAPIVKVLDLRAARREAADVNMERVFEEYLDAVAAIAAEMDRRLAGAAVVKSGAKQGG